VKLSVKLLAQGTLLARDTERTGARGGVKRLALFTERRHTLLSVARVTAEHRGATGAGAA